MPRPSSKKPVRATPSKRLAAMAPPPARRLKAKPKDVDSGAVGRVAVIEQATAMKVRTKFLVVDKQEVPVVVDGALATHYHVKLAAAFEARSILNGLATEQGNADNRIFGTGHPEAAIVMAIQSKAIADTFLTGHAFLVDFTEVVPA